MPRPVPTAALARIEYDPTVAVAAAPVLVRVTLVTLSPLTRPLVLNSVPAKVTVWPYVLAVLSAVIVRVFGFTVRLPLTKLKL